MSGHGLDIVLKQRHILENGIIDSLEHIVRSGAFRNHLESVIDKTAAERFDRLYIPLNREAGYDACEFRHIKISFSTCRYGAGNNHMAAQEKSNAAVKIEKTIFKSKSEIH